METRPTNNDNANLDSQLFLAIENSDIDKIKSLLTMGANLAAKNKDKLTPIQYASNKIGANLAAKNKDELTPTQASDKKEKWECIETIANCKKTDNVDSYNYGYALLFTLWHGQLKIAKKLLKAGASAKGWITRENKYQCLHFAVINNDPEMTEQLIQSGASLQGDATLTPLELACEQGYWSCAEIILRQKIFFTNSHTAGVAYINAVKAGELSIASRLIDAGASAIERTQDGHTCLHWVVLQWKTVKNNALVLQFAIDHNSNQMVKNNDGKTPIELAGELGYWDCVQRLIDANNHNKQKGSEVKQAILLFPYENVLINAIKQSNYAMTELLLDNGAPCNGWSEIGNIALYWAVQNDNPDTVTLLLEHGANPKIKDSNANDTFGLAEKLKHTTCLQHLKMFQLGIKPQRLTPSYVAPELVVSLRQQVDTLFNSLCDNAIKAEELLDAVQNLNKLHHIILETDSGVLANNRERCQPMMGTSYLMNSLDVNSMLGRLNAIILTINTLLNYPHVPPQFTYELNPDSAEERDIQIYLQHQQCVNDYAYRLHIFLADIKLKIENWRVKNFLGVWVADKPKPLKIIHDELATLPNQPSTEEILTVYKKVLPLLTTPVTVMDENMKQFYHYSSLQIKAMTFIPHYDLARTQQMSIYPDDPGFQNDIYIRQPIDLSMQPTAPVIFSTINLNLEAVASQSNYTNDLIPVYLSFPDSQTENFITPYLSADLPPNNPQLARATVSNMGFLSGNPSQSLLQQQQQHGFTPKHTL